MVAAITRMSASSSRVAPTRRNFRSWRTRSSFTCMTGDISPISSSRIVPCSATSMSPFLLLSAPVKAPRTCPNSSDSRSVSGSAPQLMATNGLVRRVEFPWTARATSSFPVPDSPVTSTVLFVGATRRIRSFSSWMTVLSPMICSKSPACTCAVLSAVFSSLSCRCSTASRTFALSSSTANGLVR